MPALAAPSAGKTAAADAATTTPAINPAVDTARLDKLLNDLYPQGTPVPREVWQPVNMDEETSPSEHVPGTAEATTASLTRADAASTDTLTTSGGLALVIRKPAASTAATTATSATAAVTPVIDLNQLAAGETTPTALAHHVDAPTTAPRPLATPDSKALPINTASEDELVRELKVDRERARLIIEFRDLYGPFRGPADLQQVNGLNGDMVKLWENAGLIRYE